MRILSLVFLLGLALPIAHAQDASLDPTYGDVKLSEGFTPDPHETELTAGGDITPDIDGCSVGNIADSPDVDLYYEAEHHSTLYIYAVSADDTTLLINLPDGEWSCDDDSFEDGDPLIIVENAPSGLYNIWVGTYNDDVSAATLYISEVDPR